MAAIDERRIGGKPVGRKAGERDGRRLFDEGGLDLQPGGNHHVAAHVFICGRLKRVDDDVRHVRLPRQAERLSDRQGGASVGETDFDHDVSPVSDERVTESVAVRRGESHALEVAFEWSPTGWAAGMKFRSGGSHLTESILEVGSHIAPTSGRVGCRCIVGGR